MARNTSITLGSHFDDFISRQIADGRFASASEVVRAGLRILEENETRLIALREALAEGEQSGFVNYSHDGLLAELDEK